MSQTSSAPQNNRNAQKPTAKTSTQIQKEKGDALNAKIDVLAANLKLAIGKLDNFIAQSQSQLFNITSAQRKESPSHGVYFDRWIYL